MIDAYMSAHVACDRFPSYPDWIFLSKLCIGDEFSAINSVAQLFTVDLVLDINGFFYKIKKFYLISYCL